MVGGKISIPCSVLYKRCTQFSSKAVRSQKIDPEEKFRVFGKMVQEGNIKNATRFLADKNETKVLKPSDLIDGRVVAEILQEKHPKASPLFEETFNISELPPPEKLNITSTDKKQAMKLFGSSGPSGSDANHWFDALIRFGLESSRLRDLVSQLGNLIANEIISWRKIKTLLSCRLIALDKQPGVRPIGIGETLRRLLGNAVADLTGDNLANAFGSEQLAGGKSCGIEGSIHGLQELFEKKSSNCFGLLLLDEKNALNSINRSSALLHARTLWSRASTFLYNSYQESSKLVLSNTDVFIRSEEGTTQGDLFSMLFFGVPLLPLIKKLHNPTKHKQSFYSDDAAACGKFDDLKQWMQQIVDEGPKYGYYLEPKKSFLIVHPDHVDEAKRCFEQTCLKLVIVKRYLGGFIGDKTTMKKFVHEKNQKFGG